MFKFFIEYLYIISALYKWTKHIVIVFVNNNNTDVKFRFFNNKKIKTYYLKIIATFILKVFWNL